MSLVKDAFVGVAVVYGRVHSAEHRAETAYPECQEVTSKNCQLPSTVLKDSQRTTLVPNG